MPARRVCWIDAQLPPALARWLGSRGAVATHVLDLGLLETPDAEIFMRARAQGCVVITKDEDFVRLLDQHGPPPQVVWVTVGNVRNATLLALFERVWDEVCRQLDASEALVEVADPP